MVSYVFPLSLCVKKTQKFLDNREASWFHPNDQNRDPFSRIMLANSIEMEMATDAFQLNRAIFLPTVTFKTAGAATTLPATNVTQASFP